METSLLKTKLTLPPLRRQLVPRDALLQSIQRCIDFKLTLVSAPAGFGKTTLVSQWAHQHSGDLPIAWLSLDKSDDDPVRYWRYFIGALQTWLEIDTGEVEALLQTPGAVSEPDMESFVTLLVNTLVCVQGDFAIVVDDYHVIENPPVHQSMIFLLEHLPPGMHIVIATREDPPFPLARFHGKGHLLTITDHDLRFNLEDVSQLLGEYQAPALSIDELRALTERTEGWAVGLKMAAQSLKTQPSVSSFIQSFTGSQSYIMDYLLEEVLQYQSEDTRTFLLTTSILEQMNGALCDSLTGGSDSQEQLVSLDKTNLFIQPLDEGRTWYRYEHLFAGLLQHQLQVNYGKEHLEVLHQRASAWYETNGYLHQAVEHALKAEDWESALRLLDKPELNEARTGELVSMTRWIEQLPDRLLVNNPKFHVKYYRMLAAQGRLDEADSGLNAIEKIAGDDINLAGDIAMARVLVTQRRDTLTGYEEAIHNAFRLVPEGDATSRCMLYNLLGFIYLSIKPDARKARQLFQEGYELAQRNGLVLVELTLAGGLGQIDHLEGHLCRAADRYRRAIEKGGDTTATIVPHTQLGIILYQQNDLDGAAYHLQRTIELGKAFGILVVRGFLRDVLAAIRFAQGDLAGCQALHEQADFQVYRVLTQPFVRGTHAAQRLMFSIHNETLAEAEEWGRRLEQDIRAVQQPSRTSLVRLLIAQGEKKEAAAALEEMWERTASGEAPVEPVVLRMYQALAAETEAAALDFLEDALARGEPEGIVRTFVDEYRALKPLLQKALARGIHLDYVRKLLDIMESEVVMRKSGRFNQPMLSVRELEILQLMANATTNQEIGQRLAISLSTVKTHVHHILEKLEVTDRSQAVYRARELGIL